MLELNCFLSNLTPELGSNIKLLSEIIKGIYGISCGGVTMKNISRWIGKGGSYRTIQRFFRLPIAWTKLNFLLLANYYKEDKEKPYILAIDEVVEDKSGKATYGVNWFYSSIIGRPIRSVSHHVISLVNVKAKNSYVLANEQTVKSTSTKSKEIKSKEIKKRGVGRPKGSKNKANVKSEGLLYESFEFLLDLISPLLSTYCPNVKYIVGDGSYGNKTCHLIAAQFNLVLISKLNCRTVLYFPYTSSDTSKKKGKRGRPRKYGAPISFESLEDDYLLSTKKEGKIQTKIYQIKGVWTKNIPCLLNVVIMLRLNVKTQKTSHVLLFSTDLELNGLEIIEFYSSRFQIEFNFRNAKQYFGLADFKNIKHKQIKNAVGLAFFMNNISLILAEQAKIKWQQEEVSILDLKAYYRGEKYLYFILNTLEIEQKGILNDNQKQQIMKIGAIHHSTKFKKAA